MRSNSSPFSPRTTTFRLLAGAASLAATLLSGCAFSGVTSEGVTTNTLHLNGSIFGGQQPIAGATIQLYTVGTTATGAASSPLIGGTVTSNATGGFSITGAYSCTNATQVYIVATGGNPGLGTNTYSALSAALGSCAALTSTTFVSINELTTVAAAYALAPFEGTSYTSIGANNGTILGTVGLPNAFLSANTLVSSATGFIATGLPTGLSVPGAELATLADILASCVNSTGSGSPACTQLNSVTGATNTFDAVFYIAKHPGNSGVVSLYGMQGTTPPFQPTLASAPKDFTVAVRYTGTTGAPLSTPFGIAIDGAGNAFVTNQTGNTVTAISPISTGLTTGSSNGGATPLNGPQGIAIDPEYGYFWIANPGNHNVANFSSLMAVSGSVSNFSAIPSRAIPLNSNAANPTSIATDANGYAYTVSPAENRSYAIGAGAGAVTGTVMNGSFAGPGAIALTDSATLAIGTGAGQICTSTISNQNPGTPTCTTAGSATIVSALGYNPNLGSAGYAGIGNSISTGAPLYGPAVTAASTFLNTSVASTPSAIAFDGSGRVFITTNGALYELNGTTSISPGTGGFGTLSTPRGVAVDPSGNVWATSAGDNSLSIFVGLAAPTLTPIAVNLH